LVNYVENVLQNFGEKYKIILVKYLLVTARYPSSDTVKS